MRFVIATLLVSLTAGGCGAHSRESALGAITFGGLCVTLAATSDEASTESKTGFIAGGLAIVGVGLYALATARN